MVDAAQGAIPVRPTTVWLYKKYSICERGCQDRGRQREIPDTYGKHTAPLARSSSVFGDFKKAESGSVQGATVNRRLVEPTNSASVGTIHSNLGIVKKILRLLYAERKENPDTAKADHSAWSGASGGTEFSLIIIYAVSCNSQEYDLFLCSGNAASSASNEPAQPGRFAGLFFKTRYSRRTTMAARSARLAQPRGRKTALP